MIDWLRIISMVFYAPLRGMREARDRSSLAPMALIAFISQVAFTLITKKFAGTANLTSAGSVASELFRSSMTVVMVAIIIVPLLTLVANMFDRRGSFRVVITQEYAPVAATMFYALMAVNIAAIVIAVFFHYSGIQAIYVASTMRQADQIRAMLNGSPQWNAVVEQLLADPGAISENFFRVPKFMLFCVGVVLGVKEVFRSSMLRALGISLISYVGFIFLAPLWDMVSSHVLGSPFLLFLVVILLRGYVSDILGSHRAKAAFKQNLESATLNPADASAHYNLGLIHQSRGELDAARERFERALQIDEGEIDASYQLGRIARQQKRYGDAIQNFEPVVSREPAHAQYEVWREVAATYLAAGQFEDARTALEQFLEHRPSDPEGLYLMGCAHAGLGHKREAASLMQACIEAVRTAPAYKYRASKRWLNEAQQFIKSSGS
jgi:tetratricopeptide (TPR) repeat protein